MFDYSDWESYGFDGPFCVLKDFEPEEVLKDYMMNFKPRLRWSDLPDGPMVDEPDGNGFIDYMWVNGYIGYGLANTSELWMWGLGTSFSDTMQLANIKGLLPYFNKNKDRELMTD